MIKLMKSNITLQFVLYSLPLIFCHLQLICIYSTEKKILNMMYKKSYINWLKNLLIIYASRSFIIFLHTHCISPSIAAVFPNISFTKFLCM